MIFLSAILAKQNFPRCYSPVLFLFVETFLLFTGDQNGKKEEDEKEREKKGEGGRGKETQDERDKERGNSRLNINSCIAARPS